MLAGDVQWWTCMKNMCKVHIKMDSQNVIIFQNLKHLHPPDIDCSLTRECINNTLKRKESKDINE